MSMPWDEDSFRSRIRARAAELGMSDRDVMRKAQVSEDTFNKAPKAQGRTFHMIEAIAAAVGMTVAEAIGVEQALSVPILELAVKISVQALRHRPELLPDAIMSAYDVLSERQKEGLPNDASALSTLEATLRRGRAR